MAQDHFAPLEGKKIGITNLAGAFRSCTSCGGNVAIVSVKPVGMHNGHLTCAKCGNLTSYLSREHLAAMLAAHNTDEGAA